MLDLLPGKEAKLHVALSLIALPPGPLHKFVSVYISGQAQPAAMLEMSGTLLPSVSFSPVFLDFGRLHAGERGFPYRDRHVGYTTGS